VIAARRLFLIAMLLISFSATSFTVSAQTLVYEVSLADRADHLVEVRLHLPAGSSERVLQLPVWNALYQIRDFSQYLAEVKAEDVAGRALPVALVDKSSWKMSGVTDGATVHYLIRADEPGPYGAQLNTTHAFLNLAEVLVYPADGRALPIQISFTHVPTNWKIATALRQPTQGGFSATNYDQLVDSPVEAGTFQESEFDEGGAHYRVVVDADAADYDLAKLATTCRGIVRAETAWMQDRPLEDYLFIYHFPHFSGGGGMEHAFSAAIELNAQYVNQDPSILAEVTAHEFFHLWNVKRVRPQGLEPIDYTKENYTDALWFSEGVTSTVESYTLLQTHQLDEVKYLERLGQAITVLENRPAHLTQSAEESSLDAWLEKYPAYRRPERSVSYYNKGELLGVMLDLKMRESTRDSQSLRTLFQYLDMEYAQRGIFFPESDGIRQAAEVITHADLRQFFSDYVAGTREIPWDDFLNYVGLHVLRTSHVIADSGFKITHNFDQPPIVSEVDQNGTAEHAGLAVGDAILDLNGSIAFSDMQQQLGAMNPGDTLIVKIHNRSRDHELRWLVQGKDQVSYAVKDLAVVTPEQSSRRDSWLHSDWSKPALSQSGAVLAVGENLP